MGRLCGVDERACQDQAIHEGLEITCEHLEPRSYVYCPPGGQQRDSGYVWLLLLVAIGVAAVGGVVAVMIFRRAVTKDEA
jgi:hypothetical protein